ncbi:uncharacterized protein O3C94_016591 [Discoglossus pictus]
MLTCILLFALGNAQEPPAPLTDSPVVLGEGSSSSEGPRTVLDVTSIYIVSDPVTHTPGPRDNESVTVMTDSPNITMEASGAPHAATATEDVPETEGPTTNQSAATRAENMEREGTTEYPTQSTAGPPTTEEITAETTDSVTERPFLPSTPGHLQPSQTPREPPADTTQATATPAYHTPWMSAITTSAFITNAETTTSPTDPATHSTAAPRTTRAEVQRGPSVLDVGDDDKREMPSYYPKSSSNQLFVMIVSVFTIMVVMVVVFVGFQRYWRRNNRTEFRRLQDLPMDDLMEDTPLSLYSY